MTPQESVEKVKKINRTYKAKKKESSVVFPTLIEKRILCRYDCPSCKNDILTELYDFQDELKKNKKMSLFKSSLCPKCQGRNDITYKVGDPKKKVKLVGFMCRGENALGKVRKSFKVLNSN